MPTQNEIDMRLEAALNMADQTRVLTQPAFISGIRADNKNKTGVFDPVTKADKDAELHLRSLIEKAFPGDSIVGEEYPDKIGDNDWSWCLDPIDGTRAFVAGVPVWSTLISVSYRGEPVIGIIDHPALNERYVGTLTNSGGKAWCIDAAGTSPLKTQTCPKLTDAVLSCTEPMAMLSPKQLAAYEMIRQTTRFSRLGLDAYAYALTAAGRIDLVIEAGLAPYDIRSHIPIIKGAGGAVTTWNGGNAKDGGTIVCVGDPRLLDQIYPYLQNALDS